MPATSILSENNPSEEMLTAKDVAANLKISKRQVYKLIRAGALPSVRIWKSIRVMRRDLNQFIEQHRDI
ncbi:MAG: hypothetical protein A2029_01450 [Chloroflexi bacterium RBG_19FT_COMBO_47_9]|nr:MAG: hypothetical protein A2W25_05015 [candidate division Zixibacteria bacterium RBG_16_53_22]OGO66572.1 MAG: hypothetical protein A2029_01450 [Chloroflexi bacterium RBG_19FT_COMBO_47_9]